MVLRWIPLLIGIPLIGLGTYLQGSWTDRWSDGGNRRMEQTTSRYAEIPLTIGKDWVGEDTPYSKKELEAAGAHAHLSRIYRHRETGERVSVFMICGYARDVAVHTPDFCYVGAGFEVESRPETFVVEPIADKQEALTFWTSTFLKERPVGTIHQRILWGWTSGEPWNAPNYPRWKYPGNSPLNKVYLIHDIQPGIERKPDTLSQEHPLAAFGKEFLPIVRETLYPQPAEATESPPRGRANTNGR